MLVLLIVGATSRDLINKHRRLQSYTAADFDLLLRLINASEIIVTPNILTETSNLASQIGEPARARIAETFQRFVGTARESYIESRIAAEQPAFPRLWLTDAAILAGMRDPTVLLTADLDLYLAALNQSRKAVNFHHLRQL